MSCSSCCNCPRKAKLRLVTRIILGVILVVFGANKFFNFMDMGEPSALAGTIFSAFGQSGLLKALAVFEIGVGVGLLTKILLPLNSLATLAMMASFLVFHIFFEPAGIIMTAVLTVLAALLVFSQTKLAAMLGCPCSKKCMEKSCGTGACSIEKQ